MNVTVRPLTPERRPDLQAVFEAKGCSIARGGRCMYYRESGKSALPSGVKPAAARKRRLKAPASGRSAAGTDRLSRQGRLAVAWRRVDIQQGGLH
jgi:hypothetical protein